jgi:hypothetical protein
LRASSAGTSRKKGFYVIPLNRELEREQALRDRGIAPTPELTEEAE